MNKQELLDRLHQVPSMPQVVQKVMESYRDPNIASDAVAQQIALDHGLSAKVLQVANSPFYGVPGKIGSIRDAITILGFIHVRSLVVAAGLTRTFPPLAGRPFDRYRHWVQSFRMATYADALARTIKREQHYAFTAGMFHDIGALALDHCIPEQFAGLLQQQAASGTDLMTLENFSLGFDHAEIGEEMAKLWGLPQEIQQAIRYWRTPEAAPFSLLTCMTHVAALLANGTTPGNIATQLSEPLRKQMNIDWDHLTEHLPDPGHLDNVAHQMLDN